MMESVAKFTEGVDFDSFESNREKVLAVTQALTIIGEATKNLPPEVRRRHPDIPWKRMAGMRDRLIHGYRRVDLSIVWETATRLIPTLMPKVAKAIEEETCRESAKRSLTSWGR